MEDDAKRFPLVRTSWSNEKAMALLFALLVVWQVPSWFLGSGRLAPRFVVLVALALIVDAACNLIRYHRFLCSVSAAVTAGVVWALSPACAPAASYPLTLATVVAALVLGKHLFGGTGKNLCNPAMLALAMMVLASNRGFPFDAGIAAAAGAYPVAVANAWMYFVACACLPFLAFRPFAGGFFALGTAIAISSLYVFSAVCSTPFLDSSFASTVMLSLLIACVAMTDPVTVTAHPVAGALVGAIAGTVSGASLLGLGYLFSGTIPFIILAVNAISRATDRLLPPLRAKRLIRVRDIARGSETLFVGELDREHGPANVNEYGTAFKGDVLETTCYLETLSVEDILSRIRGSRVIGLGGAGFPTDVKIETFRASPASRKALIVNAVECDPGLVHDKWLLANRGTELAEAIALLMTTSGCVEAFLALKRGTPVSPELASSLPAGVRIVRVPDRYPVGAERILIRHVTGVTVSADAIPAREGFLVLNAQTALAARDAILAQPGPAYEGSHAREWYLTVADLRSRESRVVRAREGERFGDVFARAFPSSAGGQLFAGGGLMQACRAYEDVVVGPGVNFIARGNAPRFRESPQCSRCDRCAASCPARLDVRAIAESVDAGKYDRAVTLGAVRCLSCGSCSVSCLAGKNLSHRVSLAKRFARDNAAELPEPLA